MNVDLKGAALAEHLADNLNNLEFELLIRARIRKHFKDAHYCIPNLSESYNTCSFNYNDNDKSLWNFGIGASYSDSLYLKGEVLAITVDNAVKQYELQHGNKLSLLLPAPDQVVEDDAEVYSSGSTYDTEPKKW